MRVFDWSALWHVFTTFITLYVLAKLAWNIAFDLYFNRTWRQYIKHGLGLGAVMLVSAGCASKASYVPVVYAPLNDGAFWGHTACDTHDSPIIIVYQNVPLSERKYVLEHEKAHVKQARDFGSCHDFQALYQDNRFFALYIEAEAECVAMDMRVKDGKLTEDQAARQVTARMHAVFPEFANADIVEALPCVAYSP